MDYAGNPNIPVEAHLLIGCWREAERADQVSLGLDGLRSVLPENFHGHMVAVTEEIRSSGRLLRELAERCQGPGDRGSIVLNYLQIILPCLSRSLTDIASYYEDKSVSREIRWRKMYNKMSEEAGGLQLPHRFVLYNHFLTLLKQLLARSADFDLNTLELLKSRIMTLREQRGIPPPPRQLLGPPTGQDLMLISQTKAPNVHWAEQIFSLPLPSRTALKHLRPSKAYGPWGAVNLPAGSKILFRRSVKNDRHEQHIIEQFNDDRISLTAFLNPTDQSPYLLIRTFHMGHNLLSLRGVHELCISREGSALQLKRWSQSERCGKLWVVLCFLTWEEMVLFYSSFVSLKARNTLTVQIHPDEYKLGREKRLFQAQILDDDYKHSLIVYEDAQTRGIRLHAAVWEGELRQCPVWTAFITHQSQSPTWLSRRSKHRVWLKDVQLYVFCQRYRHEKMRQNKSGAFEIYFVSEEGATRFRDVFAATCTPESSEANEPRAIS